MDRASSIGRAGIAFALASMMVAAGTPADPGAPGNGGFAEAGLVSGQVVIVFQGGAPSDLSGLLAYGSLVGADAALDYVALAVAPGSEAATAAALSGSPGVAMAYQARERQAAYVPNDPLFGQQWGAQAIGLEAAWELGLGSHNVKVAIIDTGIDYFHPDLKANTFLGDALCGVDRDFTKFLPLEDPGNHEPTIPHPLPVPLAIDDNGHGTSVAGIVAAVTDNGEGVAGLSQSCLLGVKVLNQYGSGTGQQVASGIRWAADMGADVISMSIGGFVADPLEQAAVQYALARGAVLIAAAGNAYCRNPGVSDTVEYPARYPEVIAVASLDPPGTTTSAFSSCGPKVEIAAPGEDVVTTRLTGATGLLGAANYNPDFRGTSAATPHVSGIAALMIARNPGLAPLEVRCILDATADDLGAPGRDPQFGYGRLDAAAAVAAANDPAAARC